MGVKVTDWYGKDDFIPLIGRGGGGRVEKREMFYKIRDAEGERIEHIQWQDTEGWIQWCEDGWIKSMMMHRKQNSKKKEKGKDKKEGGK